MEANYKYPLNRPLWHKEVLVKKNKAKCSINIMLSAIFTSRLVFLAIQVFMTCIVFGLVAAAETGEIQFRTSFISFVAIWILGVLYTILMPWINKSRKIGLGIFTVIMSVFYYNAL